MRNLEFIVSDEESRGRNAAEDQDQDNDDSCDGFRHLYLTFRTSAPDYLRITAA
jgi:hypothetical protein